MDDKAKKRKTVPQVKLNNSVLQKAGAGLPEITNIKELDEAVETIKKLLEDFKKMNELKGMIDVELKLKNLLEMLQEAQHHLLNKD